jgi:hypothetical protein
MSDPRASLKAKRAEIDALLSVLEWSQERLANSERIADLKSGADRESWLEDVAYWREIVSRLTLLDAAPAQESTAVQVLRRIRGWDMLDGCADGPYWKREIDAALAGDAAPAQGWQPIATAPKPPSGRRKVVDVWCVTDDHEAAKFYFGNTMSGVKDRMMWQGRVCEVYWLDGAWRPATGLRLHGLTVTPTHWMPLPAPPTTEEK